MFSFLKKQSHSESVSLVCLVTGYSVVGMVVSEFKQKTKTIPHVIYSYEVKIPVSYDHDGQTFEHFVTTALGDVIKKCRIVAPKYNSITCSIGEPWVISYSRVAHLEKRDPFIVSKSIIDDLVSRETKLFEQEIIKGNIHMAAREQGLLEVTRPLIMINGYQASDYPRLPVATVDVHIVYSVAPVDFVEKLSTVFLEAFHAHHVTFQSFEHAKLFLGYLQDQVSLFEIGGVNSTFSLMEKGFMHTFAPVPVGLHALEHKLSQEFNVPRSRLDYVFSYAHDQNILEHLRDVYVQRIMRSYIPFGDVIPRTLLEIKKNVGIIPEPIFIISHRSDIHIFEALLKRDISNRLVVLSVDHLLPYVHFHESVLLPTIPAGLAVIHAQA